MKNNFPWQPQRAIPQLHSKTNNAYAVGLLFRSNINDGEIMSRTKVPVPTTLEQMYKGRGMRDSLCSFEGKWDISNGDLQLSDLSGECVYSTRDEGS